MHTPSEVAAAEVKGHRERRGLTREALADACAQHGAPHLTYAAIVNIETGRKDKDTKQRRRNITVDELAVLAKCLGVPPVALLFPVGRVDAVQPLPGRTVPTWDALRWFTGEAALPVDQGEDAPRRWAVEQDDFAEWSADRAGLTSYRWHDRYLDEWHQDQQAATQARSEADREEAEQRATSAETKLWEQRTRLRGLGLELPELPTELRHIDAADYRPNWGNLR
ncbi:helix-turn-helix domain-containing protein [Streptomyces sp. NBC_01635]|uniref:helix-turn-helix domain-containing protein n=1 Tax=Streptomyces sp. NBC_01635 TaxID=2975904 RepID=UPI0038694B2E|nr:helix-turn-helix domain-containing protein [Streptomyces sp. NBC_01635]